MKPLILSLSLALAAPLLATVPLPAQAQQAAATPGQQVVANGSRILATLQQRRAEFRKNPAALKPLQYGSGPLHHRAGHAGKAGHLHAVAAV